MATGGKEVRTQFADQDQQTREDMRREKRRIQDQLRRLKKQEEKATKKKQKPQKQKPLTTINVRGPPSNIAAPTVSFIRCSTI